VQILVSRGSRPRKNGATKLLPSAAFWDDKSNALPLAACQHTASQQVRRSAKASAKHQLRARFFRLKTRAGFVGFVARTCHSLDWVRLALPRSPESGFAVSADVKILSREKRKMWMTFSHCIYI
jgi:hypothetical protein